MFFRTDYFTISAPTQTVSSIFGATPVGQTALSVLINGRGKALVNPRANAHLINDQVTLIAVPNPGQDFVEWTGDAPGTVNPLTVSMNQDRVVTANFSGRPTLRTDRPGLEGLTAEGFRFNRLGDWFSAWEICGTTNLVVGESLGVVATSFGEAQFTDPTAPRLPHRFYLVEPWP